MTTPLPRPRNAFAQSTAPRPSAVADALGSSLSVVVGPTGSVVALDLRTTFPDEVRDLPNVKIVGSNIVHDPVPEEAFDLIHARWTLIWIPERDQAQRISNPYTTG